MLRMHAGSAPASTSLSTAQVPSYSVLTFGSRSAAVQYCLQVSEVLATTSSLSDDTRTATVWLVAADGDTEPFKVLACDGALAAARSAGIESVVSGSIRQDAMPAARCLVIGDTTALRSQ